MRGFAAYQYHQAMNLHFSTKTDYDLFQYNAKTRANEESFNKNRFKWQYAGIEKKVGRLIDFFYLCYKANHFSYCSSQQIFRYGRLYQATDIDSLRQQVEKDLVYLHSKYSSDPTEIYSVTGVYPTLYQEYKNKTIELESLLLIDGCIKQLLTSKYSNDIIAWPDVCKHMHRVQPFVMNIFDRAWFLEAFTKYFLDGDK